MGYAIARAAENRGANVFLISGPTALTAPPNVRVSRVTTAAEMTAAVLDFMGHADIIVKCAAVADYRPVSSFDQKIKKEKALFELKLERTQDILKLVAQRKDKQIVVGFAAETQELDQFAVKKLEGKSLDMIVGNLIGRQGAGFGSDTNQVTLYYKDGRRESIGMMPKEDLAHVILDRISGIADSR